MKIYNVLDLFSGAGGFSLGFNNNPNFSIKVSIDNNKKLSETYIKNFPNVKHFNRDISNFSDEEIKEINEKNKIDVIIGGPPCQGFSLAGSNGRLEKKDERNELFLAYLKFVRIIKPKIFLMENVSRLLKHNKGKTFKEIVTLFENEGYSILYKILDTSDYGIAQVRNRIFIVGISKNNNFKFPEKISKKLTVKEILEDLPILNNGEKSNIPNHNAMKHSEQMLEKMFYVKEGGNREDIPENIRPKTGDARKYIRYDGDKPSVCVTGDMRKIFHYNQNRALTNRELARLQSFPDNFIFYGSSISIQQQIGNAVPPKLSELFSLKVKEYLDE